VYLDRLYTLGTWASATLHGRTAGLNMAGNRTPVRDVPQYTTTLFDSRMTVIGATPDIRPEIEGVSRVYPKGEDPTDWSYRRLFFYEKRLVGAALIGDMHAKVDLVKAIRAKEPLWDDRERLLSL
jgi:hypothetical protein